MENQETKILWDFNIRTNSIIEIHYHYSSLSVRQSLSSCWSDQTFPAVSTSSHLLPTSFVTTKPLHIAFNCILKSQSGSFLIAAFPLEIENKGAAFSGVCDPSFLHAPANVDSFGLG